MLLRIGQALAPEELARIRALLASADWADGRITAGDQSAGVKNNRQLPEDLPAAQQARQIVATALARNPMFVTGALPKSVYPPLFNCYSGQANAFGTSSNLRRTNLFMRVSWTLDKWQPAFDLLYTPADAGRTVTASLGWQGDRVRVDAGLRLYGGPSDAVFAQLPTRRIAYVAGRWSF